MLNRRRFVQSSLCAGVSFSTLGSLLGQVSAAEPDPRDPLIAKLGLMVPTKRFTATECWAQPRAGIVPGAGQGGDPAVVMTLNTLELSGSDVYKHVYSLRTNDLGATWSEPAEMIAMRPRTETIDGQQKPVAAADLWPCWHAASKTLLGIGHSVVYDLKPAWKVSKIRPRHTVYSTYDPQSDQWAAWQKLEMPNPEMFQNAGAGCSQRWDEPDGTILQPVYYKPDSLNSKVTVVRFAFDGRTLKYLEHGNELGVDDDSRGVGEPSITKFQGKYYLTIRHDQRAYVTSSDDGLHFEPLSVWTFDDGSELGSYNTQAHWVTHSDGLFLVYTRRGADNDHVFRHRAPLFLGRVDPERKCVIRESEQAITPNRGARMGNFGITEVSPDETWVTTAEWMQPRGCEKYGADGSIYVARIHWAKPNGIVHA